jgi:hypothetical protein
MDITFNKIKKWLLQNPPTELRAFAIATSLFYYFCFFTEFEEA